MSVAVGRQGLELLWAAALGLGLGVLYDVGRALRRVRQKLTVPVDVLFALVFFLGLWIMGVYTQGLRLYQGLGTALGAALYFLTASPRFLRLWGRCLRGLGVLRRRLLGLLKKTGHFFGKVAKKLFPTGAKWSKIRKAFCFPRGGARDRAAVR